MPRTRDAATAARRRERVARADMILLDRRGSRYEDQADLRNRFHLPRVRMPRRDSTIAVVSGGRTPPRRRTHPDAPACARSVAAAATPRAPSRGAPVSRGEG